MQIREPLRVRADRRVDVAEERRHRPRGRTVGGEPAGIGGLADEKERVRVARRRTPHVADFRDLACARRDQPRGGRFDRQHRLHVAAIEEREVRGRGSVDDVEVVGEIELGECGRHARLAIGVARLGQRRDPFAAQIARRAIRTVGAHDPAPVVVESGREDHGRCAVQGGFARAERAERAHVDGAREQLRLDVARVTADPRDRERRRGARFVDERFPNAARRAGGR